MDGQVLCLQPSGQVGGGGHHVGGVLPTVHQPVEHRDGHGRGLAGVEVGGQAGVGDCLDAFGQRGVVGHHEPAGWPGKALVGAHGHQVRALLEGVRPRMSRDQATQVRGVEEHPGVHLVGDAPDLGNRMVGEVEAATDGDERGPDTSGKRRQACGVHAVGVGVDRRVVDLEPVQPGGAGLVVGDVPTDAGGRHDDGIPGRRRGHEGVEVGDSAGRHPHLGERGTKDLADEVGGQDLDLLDRLQARLVLGAGIAERRAAAEPPRHHRLGRGVHRVGGRIEVDGLVVVDVAVALDEGVEAAGDAVDLQAVGVSGDRGHPVGR